MKKEHKLRIIKHKEWFTEYSLLAHTFRLCLQLFIGNPKEKIWKQFWKDMNLDYIAPYYWNHWFFTKDKHSDIIRIRNYDSWCLVHELTHLVDKETEDRWLESEARAYIMESLFTQAQFLSGNKFEIEKWVDLFI